MLHLATRVCNKQSLLSPSKILAVCIVVLVSTSINAQAESVTPEFENEGILEQIAKSAYWKKLLHYKSNLMSTGVTSDITDLAFFFSEQGSTDSFQELSATIEAFKKSQESICKFPARYYWLSEKYGQKIHLKTGKLAECGELQEWRKRINPGSATLIFPAAYLNGPSSMFGHTLLRVEPDDKRKDLPLVSYAVNYAANVAQPDNDVAFAFKGLFGGYPGVMAIVPYHQKIKEYGEIENRDIWEYRLKLNKNEIRQMMLHTWELKDLRSAYYFFNYNCSYLILNLIETAREDIDLTSHFRFKVIPIDTVRAVADAGLVEDVQYRPAAATVLEQHYALLTNEQQLQVKQMLDLQPDPSQSKPDNQSAVDYARILEVTYDTLRYQAYQTPEERDKNAAYDLALLNARSQLQVRDIWPEIPVPEFKPEQGHRSARFAAGYRHTIIGDIDENYLLFKARPAYHDLLDPAQGFPPGAQINFFDFAFSYNTDEQELDLESLTIIDVLSLTPVHDLFNPLSWRVNFSYERRNYFDSAINILQVTPGFGKTMELLDGFMGYALATSSLEYSPDYEDDFALGVGLQTGALITLAQYSAMIELGSNRMFAGHKDTRFVSRIGLAHSISNNLSVRLVVDRQKNYEKYINNYQLNLNWYF